MIPPSIAHYRITSQLGEGGMGAVYRATDTKLSREVAIKVIPDSFAADPDRMARFTREAQVLASLNHPNIAAIYGVEERAIVMELVEGTTLGGPLPMDEAIPLARQIAEALEYAHEKGIIHRDLKPANIKVTPQGRVKVLDFGLAKAFSNEGAAASDAANSPTLTLRATMVGVIMGTAAYMSPEQAKGKAVDRRADIWSFGVVLWEMLTGRQMFGGETVSETLAAVIKDAPPLDALPSSTPAPVRRLLARCLEKDPQRRLRDIGEARIALEEVRAEEAPTPAVEVRHALWPYVAAAVLTLALAALSTIHFRETAPQPAAVRFQVPAPEGGTFGMPIPVLSPDGRKLAFVATGKSGQSLLWVRALDSLEARALPGTGGAMFPFWSPDSRSLAFSSGGMLRKIEASGGPSQAICNINTNYISNGDWARDGFILFAGGAEGIFRVPQAGGDPVSLAKPDKAHGEMTHNFPQVLPDGRHYLFLNQFGTRENNAIFLASFDGRVKKRLLGTAYSFRYVPPSEGEKSGHLLFQREDTLMAQPIDPGTFELAGEAFPVAERVGVYRAGALFSASPNGALAYRGGPSAGPSAGLRQLTWFDRAGKQLATLGALGDYNHLALSRDATRVAVAQADPQTSNRDLWLIDVARAIPTRFTFDESEDWDPVWSPDGSRVAFSSFRDSRYTLFVKDASGSAKEEQLQKAESSERPCDWSPDGRFLMYVRNTGGSLKLWFLSDPTGDPAKRKPAPYLETPFNTTQCQFSPGPATAPRWVAYTSDESKRGHEIYVQSFPRGAGQFQVSNGGGRQPRWRRDGKELFYVAPDGKVMAVDVKTAPTFSAGNPHALFDTGMWVPTATTVFRFDVTPDGQRFLLTADRQSEAATAPEFITVVLNWKAGLKK